ncbi:sensor histidine kinase [Embleya sp. NPDC055664]
MEQSRPPLTQRLTPRHLAWLDVVAAVVSAALICPSLGRLHEHHVPVPLFAVLAIALAAAVALRRRHAASAFVLACLGYAVLAAYGFPKSPMIALVLVVYVVGLVEPLWRSVALLAAGSVLVALAPLVGSSVDRGWSSWSSWILGQVGALLAFWTVGRTMGRQRAYNAGLREQAERRARDETDRARRTLVEERLRIAREMHDVVAHSMSVIAVQAGVGHHVIAARPDEAAKALAAIETTSRAALRELRALLGVLREEAPPVGGRDGFHSAPGLADVPGLVEKTGRAGLRVDVRIDGTPRELPSGMDRAAYRIIQEALTNVVKHADTDRGNVFIHYGDTDIRIEITDDGSGPAGRGAGDVEGLDRAQGHGLIGMRERVGLYDGDFQAGPGPRGGYRVAARLPLGVGA